MNLTIQSRDNTRREKWMEKTLGTWQQQFVVGKVSCGSGEYEGPCGDEKKQSSLAIKTSIGGGYEKLRSYPHACSASTPSWTRDAGKESRDHCHSQIFSRLSLLDWLNIFNFFQWIGGGSVKYYLVCRVITTAKRATYYLIKPFNCRGTTNV